MIRPQSPATQPRATLSLVKTPAQASLRVALIEFFGIGGTADYTDCLARALADEGMTVAVITSTLFRPLSPNPPYQLLQPFSYQPTQPKIWKAIQLARAIPATRLALRRFAPDVVHAQGTVMPALEGRLYQGQASSTVCTVHDARAHEQRPWLGSFTRFYERFDRLVCHSEATARLVRQAIPAASVTVIPHGSYGPLAGAAPAAGDARRRLNLPSADRVALFFGFIRRYKGLELFVDALELANRDGRRLVGLVAGRPLYDIGATVERAKRHRIPVEWHLRFIDREDFGLYFAAADVVALPYVDTYDSGAFELAAGFHKPVVVTRAGGLTEAFDRYGYGAVLPARTPAALADALLADYPPSEAAPSIANSWETVAGRTAAVYREAVGG